VVNELKKINLEKDRTKSRSRHGEDVESVSDEVKTGFSMKST